MSKIDQYATPGNPVVDITGNFLGLLAYFQNKGSATGAMDRPLSVFGAAFTMSPLLTTLTTTPLNQVFDQAWAQTKNSSNQTVLQQTSATLTSQIASAVTKIGSSYSAYNIDVNLPATGSLRALVVGGTVFLSYEIKGTKTIFQVTTPYTGGILHDPKYQLTFDLAILVEIDLSRFPWWPIAQNATLEIENANISADNFVAQLGDSIEGVLNLFQGKPFNFLQGAEGQIDQGGSGQSPNLGALASLTGELATAWEAIYPLGFLTLTASVDGTPRTLNLRFGHPIDPAPELSDATQGVFHGIFTPALSLTADIVHAGDSVGVMGSNFPVGTANVLYLGWTDTVSGSVTSSDILWTKAGDPIQHTVGIPRNGASANANFFTASDLLPDQAYTFQVKDEDLLTETPYSAPLTIRTLASNAVTLMLQQGDQSWPLGQANLGMSGTMVATVVLPTIFSQPPVTPGIYLIAAVNGGTTLATAPLEIIAAGVPIPPTIEVVGTPLGQTATCLSGDSFPLRGLGFHSGAITIWLDAPPIGTALATVMSSDGTFTTSIQCPDLFGEHTLVAKQTYIGQLAQAETGLLIQAPPR